MCGFNGFTKVDEVLIERMSITTAHRGPDSTGFWHDASLSLAHNRLAVIDVSAASNQPLQSKDGRFVMVFNGEIYNYKELRSELASTWEFTSKGDGEVLLAGYALWGKGVFDRVKGIFACAISDREDNSVLLIRDHMGVKPLYYAHKDGVLYFSSELSGVMEATGLRNLDREALSYYVTLNYVPSPHTLVSGIYKLRPGHALFLKDGDIVSYRFYLPKPNVLRDVTQESLTETVGRSVERQLVADRDLGIFLSGGIDSSVVLHHTAALKTHVQTFCVDFELENVPDSEKLKFNSDARLAEDTAKQYGAEHTTFTLTLADVRSNLHDALLCLDEPIANPTSISQYLLAKWVREKGIVVALGGDGGDELFGGYTRHKIARASLHFKSLPMCMQSAIGCIHPRARKLGVPFGAPFHSQVLELKPQQYVSVMPELDANAVPRFFRDRYNEPSTIGLPVLDAFMRVDRESWLADESLARTDRTSMAFGVETRVPLLDIDIVDFADGFYAEQKYSLFESKKMLKDAYRDLLPSYLFSQPKRGWISPGAKWFRDPQIKKYVEEVLSEAYYGGLGQVINWGEVQKMFAHHTDGGGYHLYPLWNILQLQVWANKYKITVV